MLMSYSQLLFVGIVSLSCCLIGSSANFLSLCYFLLENRNKSHISNILFKLINITDLLICICVLPVAVSAVSNGQPHFFQLDLLCDIWVFVWYTVSRYSLFLIAVLSVARTRSLISPLRLQQKNHYLVPVGIYLFLLILQETFPYWYGETARYFPQILSCGWFLEDILKVNSVEYHTFHILFVVVESVVPILVITVSSVISWSYLCVQNRRRRVVLRTGSSIDSSKLSSVVLPMQKVLTSKDSRRRSLDRSNGLQTANAQSRSASITILLIGGVCLALNVPFSFSILLSSVEQFTDCYVVCLQDMVTSENFLLIMFVIHTGAIELNAVINPILYICRMNRLRGFIGRIFGFE